MEPCICPGMSKGLCFMPTFMTISVFCCMNNSRKEIFYLLSDLLLSLKKPMQLFFLSHREFLLQIILCQNSAEE